MSRYGNQNSVGKSVYMREEHLSPLKVAELGAGAGLAAWGIGRSPMIGRALGHGMKRAMAGGNEKAIYALMTARGARGALRMGTAPGERALRQVKAVDAAINKVPVHLRPEIATAAGLLMAGHSLPATNRHYTQLQ